MKRHAYSLATMVDLRALIAIGPRPSTDLDATRLASVPRVDSCRSPRRDPSGTWSVREINDAERDWAKKLGL